MLARKIILGFGFAVLTPMLIHYGIDVFAPRYSWRASSEADAAIYRRTAELRQQERRATSEAEKAKIQDQLDQLENQRRGRQQARQAQEDQSGRVHFFVGVPLGILVTLIGSFIRVQAVGGGLMLGGIFTFSDGCWSYWTELPSSGRFLVLLVAFAVLLWIGYQRLSELKSPAKVS